MIEADLMQAYLNTQFRVETPAGQFTIRIGATSPPLDALLEQHGVRTWAFITAWNPGSRALSDAENHARHAALQFRLEALGLTVLPGIGEGPDGSWPPEESVLVLDIDRTTARDIGSEFGQNAIVVGSSHEPAELLICGELE